MIGRHLAYAKYVLRHKWYVLKACIANGAGLRRGLLHDVSKLRPDEWLAYARTFCALDGTGKREGRNAPPREREAFDRAWLDHIHRNPHHWQYWLLPRDDGTTSVLEMPEEYVREMVADWKGAGLAQGKSNTCLWYHSEKDKVRLHPLTRQRVELLLEYQSWLVAMRETAAWQALIDEEAEESASARVKRTYLKEGIEIRVVGHESEVDDS